MGWVMGNGRGVVDGGKVSEAKRGQHSIACSRQRVGRGLLG